jgi:hypothetical protein
VTREDKWRLAQWAVISAQASTATLFSLKLLAQWGTDFGVYFVGGMSISDEYGLYTGFFDHKGPLYYAFIRLLSAAVPYSLIGAAVVLGITCAIWFASIDIGLRMLHLSKPVNAIVGFGAIAAFANQASNACLVLNILRASWACRPYPHRCTRDASAHFRHRNWTHTSD